MKHEDLQTKLDALGEKYRASDSVSEREKLNTNIRDVTIQLQDALSKGAKPCPDGADHRVIGMLRCPRYFMGQLKIWIPIKWEVGCIVCDPVLVEREEGSVVERPDGKKLKVMRTPEGKDKPEEVEVIGFRLMRWSHSAQGETPKEAVENWNSGAWVEDYELGRVPSQEIFKP